MIVARGDEHRAGGERTSLAPWRALFYPDATEESTDRQLDVLDHVRLQSIGAGLLATIAVLGVLLLYGLVPGHSNIRFVPYFSVFGAATLSTLAMVLLPWRNLIDSGSILPVLYSWVLLDIGLISLGITMSGGSRSDLYLVYLVLCVFEAGASFPRLARALLTATLVASYAITLGATGWHIGIASAILRFGMIMATAAAADVLAERLTGELRFHSEVAARSEHRAELWSRVAGLGRALETLDEDAMLSWAVDAVTHLGFEAANVNLFVANGDAYRVLHPRGLPEVYSRGPLRPSDKGISGLVQRDRRTVVVDEYMLLPDVVPELRDEGFRTVMATPIWVEGSLEAVLVGGTRAQRSVTAEEIAAIELLAAHAGIGIAQARRLEQQRRDADHIHVLVESAPNATVVMDSDLRLLDSSTQVGSMFGYDIKELIGQPLELLLPEESRRFVREMRSALADNPRAILSSNVTDTLGLHRDGSLLPIELVVGSVETPDGVVMTATIRDVTERREFERRLAHQASHDDLTGLPNRTLFLDQLSDRLQNTPFPGPSVAVCFLDIDHFKYVNDSRGHTVGDELVAEVARRIADSARSVDLVARFGGDEFAVLIDGESNRHGAVAYAWRLLSAFDRPFILGGGECYVTASAGLTFGGRGDDPRDMLRDADAAMYLAKQRGRGRVELFDEALTARAMERVEMEAALHRALVSHELALVYQPYFDIDTGVVEGVEALMRWHHPIRGELPPLLFIPVAEESGLIMQAGRWALATACNDATSWLGNRALSPFSLSVNVSSRQLEDDHLVADVAAVIQATQLQPERLILEITESFFMRDLHAAVRRLHALRELGVRIAIDDFGTGFSSLNSLSQLPIDVVKIDKSFIDGLGSRYDSVVGAVIDVAGAFDLTVIAEGVEQPEQLERLRSLGCRLAQGYLLGRPAPASAIDDLLRRSGAHPVGRRHGNS